MNKPRKILGWPLKDIVVLSAAFLSAAGVMATYTNRPIAWLSGGLMGTLWFFYGILYGCGKGHNL